MPRRLINMRLPAELLARADAEAERLGQTRTKFVERALEKALGSPTGSVPSPKLLPPLPRYEQKPFTPPRPKGGK